MQNDTQIMFKIVVIGSSNTGKTNIATRYINNLFNPSTNATVGVQFLSKTIEMHNQKIKITLWDTAGQQRYKSLSKVYYKGASGIIVVYDVTNPKSYLDIENWLKLANQNININEVVLMIVGNKIDLEDQRKVTFQRLNEEYKQKFGIDCLEVSAKTGKNIDQLFSFMVNKIYLTSQRIKDSEQLVQGESAYRMSDLSSSQNVKNQQDKKSLDNQSVQTYKKQNKVDNKNIKASIKLSHEKNKKKQDQCPC